MLNLWDLLMDWMGGSVTVKEKEIKNDSRLLAGVIFNIWMTGCDIGWGDEFWETWGKNGKLWFGYIGTECDLLDIQVEIVSRWLSSPRGEERIIGFGDTDLEVINIWMLFKTRGLDELNKGVRRGKVSVLNPGILHFFRGQRKWREIIEETEKIVPRECRVLEYK